MWIGYFAQREEEQMRRLIASTIPFHLHSIVESERSSPLMFDLGKTWSERYDFILRQKNAKLGDQYDKKEIFVEPFLRQFVQIDVSHFITCSTGNL